MSEAPILERPAGSGPRSAEIGEHGVVAVSTTIEAIVVRGVDGATARLAGPDAGDVLTEAAPGGLSVRTASVGGRRASEEGRGWLAGVLAFGFGRSARTIEVEVPRGCRLEARTASGAVVVDGVRGGVSVETVSGDVTIRDAAGDTRVTTASGQVSIGGPDVLAATVHTASGDIEVVAGRIRTLALSSMSGRVRAAGLADPALDGTVSTASGTVMLGLDGDLAVVVRTVSGRTRSTHPGATPGDRGPGWVLGRGTARLAVSTISGAVELLEPARTAHRSGPPGEMAPAAPENAATPAAPPQGELPAPTADPDLDVLRALERGEISVDEAARRLEGLASGRDSDG